MERKLTAILHADVKGYSRLIGEDEVTTLRTVAAYLDMMRTLVGQHGGRAVGSRGDSLLAEFPSVVGAVQCAVEMQRALQGHNAAVPVARQVEFRMGINLGEVVVEGEEIYGEGVNIAVRLEGVAPAGGICIAEVVYKQIKNKLTVEYEDLGEHVLKNIAEPVGVWRVVMEPGRPAPRVSSKKKVEPLYWQRAALALMVVLLAGAGAVAITSFYRRLPPAPAPPATTRLAIAVLPIQNESSEPELERVGIGRILTDAFVQILFDFPNLYVVSPIRLDGISRSLGRPFEDTGTDLQFARTVSEKADANAMLSGKLARVGSTYVLNTTLTELPSERLLGTFQAQSDNSEHLLKDLTWGVSESIRTKLDLPASSAANKSVDQVVTGSLEAYAHAVRGLELTWEGDWQAAIAELNKALESDPQMGLAWSGLACAYSWAGDDARSKAALRKAEELTERMNRKEQRWFEVVRLWGNGNSALYRQVSEQYIHDFPDDREGYFYLGLGAQYLEKNCRDALIWYEKTYALTPNFYPVTKAIVDCQLKLNSQESALSALERYLEAPLLGESGRTRAQGLLDKLRKKS